MPPLFILPGRGIATCRWGGVAYKPACVYRRVGKTATLKISCSSSPRPRFTAYQAVAQGSAWPRAEREARLVCVFFSTPRLGTLGTLFN
jgi:hypothetical protein